MNRTTLRQFILTNPKDETSLTLKRLFARDDVPDLFKKIFQDVVFHVLFRTELDDDDAVIDLQTVLFDYVYSYDLDKRDIGEWITYPGAKEALDTVLKIRNYDDSAMMFHDAVSEYAKQLIFKIDAIESA